VCLLLQCVAAGSTGYATQDCVAVCCSVLQCVAMCCSRARGVHISRPVAMCCSTLLCVAAGSTGSATQDCVAVCCSVLQCLTVSCSACVLMNRSIHENTFSRIDDNTCTARHCTTLQQTATDSKAERKKEMCSHPRVLIHSIHAHSCAPPPLKCERETLQHTATRV